MRCSVVPERGDRTRFSKQFFGIDFSGAVLSAASAGIEDENETVPHGDSVFCSRKNGVRFISDHLKSADKPFEGQHRSQRPPAKPEA